MKPYRKLPVVIHALQLTEDIFTAEHPNCAHLPGVTYDPLSKQAYIPTLEGTMTASLGDWIIRGIKGEHYPCKPDIFEKTYEPVTEGDVPHDKTVHGYMLSGLRNAIMGMLEPEAAKRVLVTLNEILAQLVTERNELRDDVAQLSSINAQLVDQRDTLRNEVRQWESGSNTLRWIAKDALGLLKSAKAKIAPGTNNSDADVCIARLTEYLNPVEAVGVPVMSTERTLMWIASVHHPDMGKIADVECYAPDMLTAARILSERVIAPNFLNDLSCRGFAIDTNVSGEAAAQHVADVQERFREHGLHTPKAVAAPANAVPSTDEEIATARADVAKLMGIPLDEITFSCDDCELKRTCPLAFDPYNTDGECLAEK